MGEINITVVTWNKQYAKTAPKITISLIGIGEKQLLIAVRNQKFES